MNKNHGAIIEYTVRKNGYNISDLAKDLEVNRRSVYNYFASATLKPNIIFKIGKIIRHDFSNEFPEFFTSEDFAQQVTPAPKFNLGSEINDDDAIYKAKYIALLEKYNELLVEAVNAA